ncbi:MAG: hypothetical protein V3573_08770 [Desulfovibrionaceae bacterium]
MEIGWYLRFTRDGDIEALIDEAQLGQIEHALHIVPEWEMESFKEDGHLRIRLRRGTAI